MEILVVDQGINEDKVVLAFENSSGEIEYTVYHRGDGGVIDPAFESLSSMGAFVATEAGMTAYQDYELKEIE